MADYGFGSGQFGLGRFGRANLSKDALWERSIPFWTKRDDAGNNQDLERFLEVAGEFTDYSFEKALNYIKQTDPVDALSGQESSQSLTVLSTEVIEGGTVRVTVDPADTELVELMFPASLDDDGVPRQDGWVAEVDEGLFLIPRVRSYDEESEPEGAVTIDVATDKSIPASLEVRPPDILFRLGSNFGVVIDRADPPDFSRRAIYRHRLLRDLKVSGRMFRLLGAIYGFDVEASGLFCISEDWFNSLRITSPENAFEIPAGSGQYFSDIELLGHRYDAVPADVIPADLDGDFDIAITVGAPVETDPLTGLPLAGTGFWCFAIDAAVLPYLLELGYWQVVDADGDAHWIDEVRSTDFIDEDTGVSGDGASGPFAVTAANLPVFPGSLTVKWDSGTVQQSISDNGSGVLQGPAGSGTVNYDTGAVSFTTTAATDVAPILLDYQQRLVCVRAALAPASGAGFLRKKAHFVCREDWKPAAVYRVVATPAEVSTEPGADITRLSDRIEQKVRALVPIHIRLLEFVFALNGETDLFGPGEPVLTGQDFILDNAEINAISGLQFDATPADTVPLDTGAFILTGTLTIS